ncbi:MAG: hypothetical protein Q9208_007703 [Pyrenodesmia sp. 3 TL-2023]
MVPCETFKLNGVVRFVNVSDPYASPSSPEPDETALNSLLSLHGSEGAGADAGEGHDTESMEAQTRGLEALSAAALYTPSASAFQKPTPYPVDALDYLDPIPSSDETFAPGVPSSQTQSPLGLPNSLDLILNTTPTSPPTIDPDLQSHEVNQHVCNTSRRFNPARGSHHKASTETDQKIAFLLRHFSEVTGRWMDLFDQTTYFSSHIPVKSISSPLLKHAACAYSAKQLGRVGGRKAAVGGFCSNQATMEMWENAGKENWNLLAAEHYDQAISLLKETLQWDHASLGENSSEDIDKRYYAPRTLEGMVKERRLRRRQFGSAQSTARSDDLLAATAILCEYESIDASAAAWAHHLSGTKSLLDVVEVGMMPLDSPAIPLQKKKPSQARKAIFWNFARQDMFAAFRNECRTRLDTEDIPMWKDAGLLLDENNLVIPSNTPDSGLPEGNVMREDMIGNSLIWLVSKMMNLICSAPDTDTASLSAKWAHLAHELETWFNGVPETFMPSAVIPVHPHGASLTEVWSSIPVTQATIMTWHMAQVLMLVHKPPPPQPSLLRRPTIAARVKSYRDIDQNIAYHSRQILGICLSRPDAGVRINALHPLYVAGQCLAETAERRVVLDLLRGVERDLGWATEYRVQQLLQEWGWEDG